MLCCGSHTDLEANIVDTDPLASEEASRSGASMLTSAAYLGLVSARVFRPCTNLNITRLKSRRCEL